MVFPKMYFSEKGWSPGFFVTFNIIISDIFPEKISLKFLNSFRRYEGFLLQIAPAPPAKVTFKKPSLIRVNAVAVSLVLLQLLFACIPAFYFIIGKKL